MNFVTSYCNISNHLIKVNGKILFTKDDLPEDDFSKQVYRHLKIDYPKFYKMDSLSKIAFLGVEFLKKQNRNILEYADDKIALLFANALSSADTDIKFEKSYKEDESPSPSLFVYTLPNILIGEVAIRNNWFGEVLFAIMPRFNPVFFANYCNILLEKKSEACMCGWVNILKENSDAFLFFAEKKERKEINLPLNPETLASLYK